MGSFKYINSITSAELPEVYQLSFCDAHRTMTWRYPDPRSLTGIESMATPLLWTSYSNSPAEIVRSIIGFSKFFHFL